MKSVTTCTPRQLLQIADSSRPPPRFCVGRHVRVRPRDEETALVCVVPVGFVRLHATLSPCSWLTSCSALSSMLSRPMLINRADCTFEMPTLALEINPGQPY